MSLDQLSLEALGPLTCTACERAARALSRMIGVPVAPGRLGLLGLSSAIEAPLPTLWLGAPTRAAQYFLGTMLGVGFLAFDEAATQRIVQAFTELIPAPATAEATEEILIEIANVLLHAYMGTISALAGHRVTSTTPHIYTCPPHAILEDFVAEQRSGLHTAALISCELVLGERQERGLLMVLLATPSPRPGSGGQASPPN